MKPDDKLQAAIAECQLHADVLADALKELGDVRFNAESVQNLSREARRLLDQMAYRFAKLQDSLGEKCLPGLLLMAEEPLPPSATFAEKLQRLERLGAIGSVGEWRELREIRNQIAHEYIDQPLLMAASINRFIDASRCLLAQWERAKGFFRSIAE
jgi:hypothetical protein